MRRYSQDKKFYGRIFISLENVEVPLIFATYTTVCEAYYYIKGIEIFWELISTS